MSWLPRTEIQLEQIKNRRTRFTYENKKRATYPSLHTSYPRENFHFEHNWAWETVIYVHRFYKDMIDETVQKEWKTL